MDMANTKPTVVLASSTNIPHTTSSPPQLHVLETPKIPKKLNIVTKFLLAATMVNFALVIVVAISMTAFETRTAAKAEFEEISNEIVAETQGAEGPEGSRGPEGPEGPTGVQGPPGPRGSPGQNGTRGSPGYDGQKGARGDRGYEGQKGDRGDRGERGEKGSTGSTGIAGSQGVKGERGATGPPGAPAAMTGGVTYTRWGSQSCPTGATAVYSGTVGAAPATSGGGSNYICMPSNPEYSLSYNSGSQGYSYIYAPEYQAPLISHAGGRIATCVLCYVPTRYSVIMIPAKATCPDGWTREYYGFLMSAHSSHRRTMYTCVDRNMGYGTTTSYEGYLYHVEAYCNGMACPPYNNYRELNCVVCTK